MALKVHGNEDKLEIQRFLDRVEHQTLDGSDTTDKSQVHHHYHYYRDPFWGYHSCYHNHGCYQPQSFWCEPPRRSRSKRDKEDAAVMIGVMAIFGGIGYFFNSLINFSNSDADYLQTRKVGILNERDPNKDLQRLVNSQKKNRW